MEPTKPEQTAMNVSRTTAAIDTKLTRGRSLGVLNQTYRELTAVRNKHGAKSPIGYRCSNIMELIQAPELPTSQLARQMADLQRLLAVVPNGERQ